MYSTLQKLARVILVFGASGLCSPAQAGEEAPVPRYGFKVGQVLSYKGSDSFKYQNGSLDNSGEWKIWVVKANGDGSFRVIMRQSTKMSQTMNGKTFGDGREQVTLAHFNIFPDGRRIDNSSIGYMLDPSKLLPRLPGDASEAKTRWAETDGRNGGRTEYQAQAGPKSGAEFVFEANPIEPMDKIYGMSRGQRVAFDLKKGFPVRISSHSAQTYGFNGKGTGQTELESISELTPNGLSAFAAETDRYFVAQAAYESLSERATREYKNAGTLLSQAAKTLKEVSGTLTLPDLKDQVASQLKQHAEMETYQLEDAKRKAEVLGKPAAEWETKDLDGKVHRLKDYRGKVVVLDFWYRGCGWCIKAMPQIKQLVDDFKNQPVVFLGMNTDRKDEDARFVIDAMALNYNTLKADGLPEKYGVNGFPTLVIIDPEGNVAEFHVGYAANLRELVAKHVKGLLAAK